MGAISTLGTMTLSAAILEHHGRFVDFKLFFKSLRLYCTGTVPSHDPVTTRRHNSCLAL
jgi:hypothetical protein